MLQNEHILHGCRKKTQHCLSLKSQLNWEEVFRKLEPLFCCPSWVEQWRSCVYLLQRYDSSQVVSLGMLYASAWGAFLAS